MDKSKSSITKHRKGGRPRKPYPEGCTGWRIQKQLNDKKKTEKELYCYCLGYNNDSFSPAETSIRHTLNNWYDGKMPTSVLIRMSEFLDVSIDYILCKEDGSTHDYSFIMKETGLSENAVIYLNEANKNAVPVSVPDIGISHSNTIARTIEKVDVNRVAVLDKLINNPIFTELLVELSKLEATKRERIHNLKEAKIDNSKAVTKNVADIKRKVDNYNLITDVIYENETVAKLAKVNASALFTNLLNSIWQE